jgi:hypothetical protein
VDVVDDPALLIERYSGTWWDERVSAVSAVITMVMQSNPSDNQYQQQHDGDVRRMFQPEREENLSGAPSGAPATIVVHSQSMKSVLKSVWQCSNSGSWAPLRLSGKYL